MLRPTRGLPTVWISLLVVVAAAASPGRLHLRLVKAEPAVDGRVTTAPSSIRLYFSEQPQLALTTVALASEGGREIALGKPERGSEDGTLIVVAVRGAMSPGTYTVAWRTMARDGHVVRGDYQFVLRPAE